MRFSSDCPSDKTLQAFAAGLLDEATARAVREHLAGCPSCRSRADKLPSTLEQPSWPESPSSGPTVGEDSTIGLSASPHEPDADPSTELHFLQPSANIQALGRVGSYDVLEVIGRGGMGVVFRAFDAGLNRAVAVKVLSPQLAASPRARRRFRREAQAAAGLSHPNVVTVHAVEEQSGMPYLVMEYVEGRTLRQRLRQPPPMDLTSLLRIGSEMTAGLAAAHAKGVVHRDIKPANILLEAGTDRVKITDFGLAVVVMDVSQHSSADQVAGTPAYMSPEQVRGERVDPRSDLFSLGCVLYAMVTGQSPFHGSHALEVARKISDYQPPLLHECDPAVPKSLSALVRRLIAKHPKDRYQTAAEVQAVLEQLLAQAKAEPTEVRFRQAPPPPPRRGRKRLLAGLLACVCLAGLLGAIQHWTRPAPAPGQTLTVAKAGADYTSITDALAHASPGMTIRVMDDAVYPETVAIDRPARLHDITLESTQRATIAPPERHLAALVIRDTPHVTVRGFRIQTGPNQHNLMILGETPGVLIEDVAHVQPEESGWACVYITERARGSADGPIRLSSCELRHGHLGVVIQGDGAAAVSHVVLTNNRFAGPGTSVFLNRAAQEIDVRNNIFSGQVGQVGVAMCFPEPDLSRRIRVSNNTFFGTPSWLTVDGAADDVRVCNNLVLGAERLEISDATEKGLRGWSFRCNWWEPAPGTDRKSAGRFAEIREQVELLSRDGKDAGFLRPKPGSPLTRAGAGGDLPAHVGALLPP